MQYRKTILSYININVFTIIIEVEEEVDIFYNN